MLGLASKFRLNHLKALSFPIMPHGPGVCLREVHPRGPGDQHKENTLSSLCGNCGEGPREGQVLSYVRKEHVPAAWTA